MSHIDDWDDNRIVLHISGDDYDAYSSPEAEGGVFVDDERVSATEETGDGKYTLDRGGAPFPFDIVFDGRHPQKDEVVELEEELGEAFSEQFDQKVNEVYEIIEGTDDPLETIMDIADGSLVGEE